MDNINWFKVEIPISMFGKNGNIFKILELTHFLNNLNIISECFFKLTIFEENKFIIIIL